MWSEIIVGIATGLASTWLSIFALRTQRSWERKNDAYKELLEALQRMKSANDEEYLDEITYRSMTPERHRELAKVWHLGKVVAYKYADIGSIDTGPAVEQIMNKFRDELDDHEPFSDYFQSLDHAGGAIGHALRSIKVVAIQDAKKSAFRVPRWIASIDTSLWPSPAKVKPIAALPWPTTS